VITFGITDIAAFVSKIIPDLVGPGDEISVFVEFLDAIIIGVSNVHVSLVINRYSIRASKLAIP